MNELALKNSADTQLSRQVVDLFNYDESTPILTF